MVEKPFNEQGRVANGFAFSRVQVSSAKAKYFEPLYFEDIVNKYKGKDTPKLLGYYYHILNC